MPRPSRRARRAALAALATIAALATLVPAAGAVGVIPPGGSGVTGTVTGPGGVPIVGALVERCPAGAWSGCTVIYGTDAPDGSFTVAVPAGTYRLIAIPPAGAGNVSPAWVDGVVVPSGTVQHVDIQLPVGATISGRVMGPGNVAVAGATVGIACGAVGTPPIVWCPPSTPTAADGTYTLGQSSPARTR